MIGRAEVFLCFGPRFCMFSLWEAIKVDSKILCIVFNMCREAAIQEHEQKIIRYQAILAARLKAKFFSKKAFDRGTHPLFNHLNFLESPDF